MNVLRSTAIALLLLPALSSDASRLLTVTSSADSGPGTFRQAILDANATDDWDQIQFAIANDETLVLSTPLPEIVRPVTLIGPGSKLVIDGRQLGNASGIVVRTGWSELSGLVLMGFSGWGIELHENEPRYEGDISIDSCTLGLDPRTRIATPNRDGGILVDATWSVAITNNTILGGGTGIAIVRGSGGVVQGNSIGADRATGTILPTRDVGIRLDGGTSFRFGGSGPCQATCPQPDPPNAITSHGDGMQIAGSQNRIEYESVGAWEGLSTPGIAGDGIVLRGTGNSLDGVSFSGISGRAIVVREGNHYLWDIRVSQVAGMPIDLQGDGPTQNDPGDIDHGPNELLNAPRLISATSYGKTVVIRGALDTAPSTRVNLGVYRIDSGNMERIFDFRQFSYFPLAVTSGIDGRAEFETAIPSSYLLDPAATSLAIVGMTGDGFSELSQPVRVDASANVRVEGSVELQMPPVSQSPFVSFLLTIKNDGEAALPWHQNVYLDLSGGRIEEYSVEGVGGYCINSLLLCILPGIPPGGRVVIHIRARTTTPIGSYFNVHASIYVTDTNASNNSAIGTTRIIAPKRMRPARPASSSGSQPVNTPIVSRRQ